MKNKFPLFLLLLSLLVLCGFPVLVSGEAAEVTPAPEEDAIITTNQIPGWPQGPEIPAGSAYVMDTATGTVLYAKGIDDPYYPSSSVKILTCLLALENSNLDEEVIMTSTGVSGVTDGGANIAAQIDEAFTMEQCLYAIMLASANDIALQVAEHVGGSVEHFVEMMNERARELGCTNTVFSNPTGLPDETQHITAHDLALITAAAMENETFRTIASALSYTIPPTNVSGGERNLSNKFTMIDPGSDAFYAPCLGGKEGYTQASGSVLTCTAKKEDMTLVCSILFGAPDETDDQAIALLDYAFDSFTYDNLGDEDFNVVEGGLVILPRDADASSITYSDAPTGEGLFDRTYLFAGTPVGRAVSQEPEVQDTSASEEGERNLAAAEGFTRSHTPIPYYIIGIVCAVLVIFLITRIVKVAKK